MTSGLTAKPTGKNDKLAGREDWFSWQKKKKNNKIEAVVYASRRDRCRLAWEKTERKKGSDPRRDRTQIYFLKAKVSQRFARMERDGKRGQVRVRKAGESEYWTVLGNNGSFLKKKN